jgi:hypothetical protein
LRRINATEVHTNNIAINQQQPVSVAEETVDSARTLQRSF